MAHGTSEQVNGSWKTTATMSHSHFIRHVTMPENKKPVVSTCSFGTLTVHELCGENWVREEIDSHHSYIYCDALCNGGKRVALGGMNGEIGILEWTVETWSSIMFGGGRRLVGKVALSADGRTLFSEDDGGHSSYFEERDGAWSKVDDDSKEFEEYCNVDYLKKDNWPDRLSNMNGWIRMWKLPYNYFGVFMVYKPYISFVQRIG